MIQPLALSDVVIRLALSCLFAGVIGLEREYNSRPAGIRTHLLVCIGATILALIQVAVVADVWAIAQTNPIASDTVRTDPVRLICQVVNGIGFLGAGTIVTTKSFVRGLTTAASLWATAGLGLAVGMGYYKIALIGFLFISFVLVAFKRFLILPAHRRIQLQYAQREGTRNAIAAYFQDKGIRASELEYSVFRENGEIRATSDYAIELPRGMSLAQITDDLSAREDVSHIAMRNS